MKQPNIDFIAPYSSPYARPAILKIRDRDVNVVASLTTSMSLRDGRHSIDGTLWASDIDASEIRIGPTYTLSFEGGSELQICMNGYSVASRDNGQLLITIDFMKASQLRRDQ